MFVVIYTLDPTCHPTVMSVISNINLHSLYFFYCHMSVYEEIEVLEINFITLLLFSIKEESKVHKQFSYTITFPYFVQKHKIQIQEMFK